MIQDAEAEPWMRPLQNQLLVVVHFTTAPGLWIPQYLRQRQGRTLSVVMTTEVTIRQAPRVIHVS